MATSLALGDTVVIEDREYVVLSIQCHSDFKGRSATITALDPFLAQQHVDAWNAQQALGENQQSLRAIMPQLEKAVRDAASDQEG